MADWPPLRGDCTKALTKGQSGSTFATAVLSNAGVNIKGAWATVFSEADLSLNAEGLLIQFFHGAGLKWLVDVGIGNPPVPVLRNLLIQQLTYLTSTVWYLPIAVPAGTRISMRGQTPGTASYSIYAMVTALSQGFLPASGYQRIETVGANTTYEPPQASSDNVPVGTYASGGMLIDPGLTANAKCPPVYLGTLSRSCSAVMIALGKRCIGTAGVTNARWFLDICLDAAGTQVVLPNLSLSTSSSTANFTQVNFGPIPMCLPAGATLYASAQCTDASVTVPEYRKFEMAVYAFS